MTEQRRPRILLVTRNLPPLVGGMERLNWHMAQQLSRWSDVRIVGPEGAAALAPEDIFVREVPLNPLPWFLVRALAATFREARAWKPDVVLAGSGLTAPLARVAAVMARSRAAVFVHGLDVAVQHPLYRAIWFRAIQGMHRVIANSDPTAALCRAIGVSDARLGIVHPGVDLPSLACAEEAAGQFRNRHDLVGRKLLLSVGRLSERKGLREFVAHAMPRIVKACPDATLLVVGDAPDQALHARGQSRESIQAAADAAGIGGHVRFIGVVTDYGELSAIYSAADLHVFPVRELPGDPEGFGMVAVEAAAHGLPTVAFATGGVVDAVREGVSGYLVAPGDYAGLADAAIRVLDDADAGLRARAVEFGEQFAWPQFGRKLSLELARCMPPGNTLESAS